MTDKKNDIKITVVPSVPPEKCYGNIKDKPFMRDFASGDRKTIYVNLDYYDKKDYDD